MIEKHYGIIVRHADGTRRLFGTVNRSDKGDVYANWVVKDSTPPSPNMKPWNPHASYHASGQKHSKSHNRIKMKKHLQRPDATFTGSEMIESLCSGHGRSTTLPVVTETFDGEFEVDAALIDDTTPGWQVMAVYLVAPGAAPFPACTANDTVLAEKAFKDDVPWILVRLVNPSM